MSATRSMPVVGVFASTVPDTLDQSEEIGYQLVVNGCLLLTGGTGCAPGAVKDRAICGAERAIREGRPGAWVGVRSHRERGEAVPCGPGIVIQPSHGDQRNYVEAHLCDGAIAMVGGPGTASEVAFCLALGRPVVLVGVGWQTEYGNVDDDRSATLARLIGDAKKRVPAGSGSPLGRLIDDAYRQLEGRQDLSHLRYVPASEAHDAHGVQNAKDVVSAVLAK